MRSLNTPIVIAGLETPVVDIAKRLMAIRISAIPVIGAKGHVVNIGSDDGL